MTLTAEELLTRIVESPNYEFVRGAKVSEACLCLLKAGKIELGQIEKHTEHFLSQGLDWRPNVSVTDSAV